MTGRTRRMLVLAAGLIGVGWAVFRDSSTELERPAPPVPVSTPARPSLAVLGFKNLSDHDDTAWLSTAFSEMLSSELAAGGALRLIPGATLAQMKVELRLPVSASLDPRNLRRIRRHLAADLVVSGSYFVEESGRIRLDLRLQDAADGEVLAAFSSQGSQASLLDLMAEVGERLRGALGVSASPQTSAVAREAHPSSPEAAHLYAQGLEALHRFDAPAALELLARAAGLEPDALLVRSALAGAWAARGYDEEAETEARRAFERPPTSLKKIVCWSRGAIVRPRSSGRGRSRSTRS